ncbi:MAG: beta-galactosidase, partial [Nonomuraea sp.]|nr:beta-galactosidase [Nonomuraea sp.]
DEHDKVRLGGYPGAWRDLLGVTVEEFFPLKAGETVELAGGGAGEVWSEVARATTAEVLDTYATGEPAWTRNTWEAGAAHYVTTLPADPSRLLAAVCAESGVATTDHPGVELVRRTHPDGRSYLFAINHTDRDADVEATGTLPDGTPVDGRLTVPAGAVRIVTR